MHQDDPGLEQRLSRFEAQLDRFSFALRQWQETQAHPRPENPSDLDQRIRSLEETVSREALVLRQLHEEPLKQLQGHAQSLTELSRNLQALVTDLRIGAGSPASTQASAASWPLERVVHLHDELRADANERRQPRSSAEPGARLNRRPGVFICSQAAHEQAALRQTAGRFSRKSGGTSPVRWSPP